MIFVKKPSAANEGIAVLGLSVVAGASERADCVRASWTAEAAEALVSIAAAARAGGDAAGNRLPHATLRALLAAGLPDPLYVTSDLGRIGQPEREGYDRSAFAECAGSKSDCMRAASRAVRAWTSDVLAPWASRRGVPESLVEALSGLFSPGGFVTVERKTVDLLSLDPLGNGFPDMRDAIHAALVRRLAGSELFEGMGPVRALVRSRTRDNSVDFLTFPRAAQVGAWSMRARLTVETLPGQTLPFVRLDVSRLRWCPKVPSGLRPRQRRVMATVFGPDPLRAVSFEVPVTRGSVTDPEDPAFVMSALKGGIDPGEGFASLVATGPRDGTFVGIPYAPGYEPVPSVASGSTELDCLDCIEAVTEAMEGILEPIQATSVPSAKRPARSSEDIPALRASNILGEIARSLGHNEIDDAAIAEAWEMLHRDSLPRGVSVPAKAAEETRRFDELRTSNTARIRQTYGTDVPALVVLSPDAVEGSAVADIAATLFQGRMRIEHRLLPEGVHGPRKGLANADQSARGRYESRVALWKPFAEGLLEEFGPCRVLVNAPRFMDDPVNKIAGRVSLARFGSCNVQYLDRRGNKADDWFYRIQAAVLDLMFGHSGIVSPVVDDVAAAFPDAATRPRAIVGVSVVSQNRTFSRTASSFFLSVSIDVASGRTTATAGRPKDGTIDLLGPLPFYELVRAVASWDGASIGHGETAKADFQSFLDAVVGGACDRGERPLVMIDASHARQLWPSASNRGWAGPHVLDGRPLDFSADWRGARIVRVQDTVEPSVIVRKSRRFAEIDPDTGEELPVPETVQRTPTLTEAGRLVRLPGPAANYVSSGDLDGQQKIAKGLSVYRQPSTFRPVSAADRPAALGGLKVYAPATRDLTDEPYRMPGAIGILVAHCLPGDDEDRIAALVHALREGFGHTRSPVRLPAPLFQTRKVAEYIPAYVLDEQEDDDCEAAPPEDTGAPSPSGEDGPDDGDDGAPSPLPPEAPPGDGASPTNPLLLLTGSKTTPLPERNAMTLPAFIHDAAKGEGADGGQETPAYLRIPPDLHSKAGDDLVRQILESVWVGPTPEDVLANGFLENAVAHASLKSRQLIRDAIDNGPRVALKHLVPHFDPRDEAAFLEFMRFILSIGDGITFINSVAAKITRRGTGRWIFNSFYEGFSLKLKGAAKPEPAPNSDTVGRNPIKYARLLQDMGEGLTARRYFVLESLFMASSASAFAHAAERLAKEHGPEWAETAAFCRRQATYFHDVSRVNALKHEWFAREGERHTIRPMPAYEMPDLDEVGHLDSTPETPAPSCVTTTWLRDKISLNGAFRSHLHAQRATFNEMVGDPSFWPDDKPSAEEMTERVAKLFSVPQPILGTVSRRDRESLFRPFYRKLEGMQRSIALAGEQLYRPDWEDVGFAPVIFLGLAGAGYRSYAGDFAILRAIDHPSWALQRAVEQAGPTFAEVADFIRNRRRAALWFAIHSGEESSCQSFVDRFERGEPLPPQLDDVAGLVHTGDEGNGRSMEVERHEDDGMTGIDDLVPASGAYPATAVQGDLDSTLASLGRVSAKARQALSSGDHSALDELMGAAARILADAIEAARALPRLISNETLLARTVALSALVSSAAERVGEVEMPEMPEQGMIHVAAAEHAERELVSGEAASEKMEEAFAEISDLSASLGTAKFKDHPPIQQRIGERAGQAAGHLEAAAAAVRASAILLVPELEAPSGGRSSAPHEQTLVDTTVMKEAGPGSDIEEAAPEALLEANPDEAEPETRKPDAPPLDPVEREVAPEALPAVEDAMPEVPADALGLALVVGADEDDEPFDEAALERLAESAVKDESEPDEEAQAPSFDPDTARINDALDRFVGSDAHAYAYHLALAAEMEGNGGIVLTSDEARTAAIAGHLNHVALQGRTDIPEALVATVFRATAAAKSDQDPERSAARLLPLLPLTLELGVFFPASGAGELLREFEALPNGLEAKVQDVFESVGRIRHANIAFSRSMLANVATEIDCAKAMENARSAMLAKAEQCPTLRFNLQTVTKICATLAKGDGLVGQLHTELRRGVDDAQTIAAVSAFATAISDRSRVVQILDETEQSTIDRAKGIVGVARDKFVQFFGDFHAKATAYLEAAGEAEAAKAADRPKVRQFAREIAQTVGVLVDAVEEAGGEDRVGRAARATAPRLRRFVDLLSGDPATPTPSDMHQACHAAMAILPELDFGRSWLPTPYDPARIVDLLCRAEIPPLPAGQPDRDEAFEAAVRRRFDRSSFVGAWMLLDAGRFLGISESLRRALRDELVPNLDMATKNIRAEAAEVRRSVERVIRFGSLRQSNDTDIASNLLSRVDNIESVTVPVEVDAEGRSEDLDDEGIYDVSVAIEVLEEIKETAQALLDEPRDHLLRKIDELALGGADPTHVDRLRQLCQKDDLLTAEEFIAEAAQTGRIPESRSRNARFEDFSRRTLPGLSHLKRDAASDVAAALRAGNDYSGLRFSTLGSARRDESSAILEAWRDLFRRIAEPSVGAHLSGFLDRIGIPVRLRQPMPGSAARRTLFWADFRGRVMKDDESLILPDFGSQTDGEYRVVLSPSLPSEAAILDFCSTAATNGIILLVGDIVSEQQRRAFHVKNLEARRRILLVDAASLYHTLAEQSSRPLTLLELAQPYSYVFPYNDWGKQAVPPEMFVGRKDDITQIMATEGSCIVYGGRRMGKTAIFQHLRSERHAPENGMLVAFVDASDIGKMPSTTRKIWSDIVAALPEIFDRPGASTEPRRVSEAIRKWLAESPRRRVVLLIDECDNFVVADAHDDYSVFRDLQTLMTETKRRFKFVLSGLSNVTKLVQTGNPPLKQIAANPRRIGSLTGAERKDAEDLVLRPLAAIGVTIERTDVWRILSHANYYPVLIQTYAQHLLEMVAERGRLTQKPIREIGPDLVSNVLDDRGVKDAIKAIFDNTLAIDQRYRLIAYVVANLAARAESEGRLAEGFSTREIRDHALAAWENGFLDKNRFSLFDDLLDEMEGLGIVRRVADDRWTLRSTAVVRLLGNHDEVTTAIEEFAGREAPLGFDPRSHRRVLHPAKGVKGETRTSPLTLGQEQEILRGVSRATVVLGTAAADIGMVPLALRSAPDSFPDGETYDMRFPSPTSAEALVEEIRSIKPKHGGKVVAVISPTVPWTSAWVRAAIQAKNVAKGSVRIVFVGSDQQAASISGDEQLSLLTAHVAIVPLEPWSTTFFQDMALSGSSTAPTQGYDQIANENGGWNAPMWQIFRGGRPTARVATAVDPTMIGLSGKHGEALRRVARLVGAAAFSAADADDYLQLDESLRAIGLPSRDVVEYGLAMGLLVPAPGKVGADARTRFHRFTSPAIAAAEAEAA